MATEPSESLKTWVKNQLVASPDAELNASRERAKAHFSLASDGAVNLKNPSASARNQIWLYLIGAAYAKAGDLRQDDVVGNKELIDRLHLQEGSVRPRLVEMRGDGTIVAVGAGMNRINHSKIVTILDRIEKEGEER